MTSHLETACRALWLVDIGLLDVRARSIESMADRVWLRLDWLGIRDEASAREAAGRLFSPEPRLKTVLDQLCAELFIIRSGQAVLKADHTLPMGRRLIRVVDPDTLVALHPKLVLAQEDRCDWPAVPLDDGGLISGLAAKGSVETHIHLGGALPPCFYWRLFVSGALAPEAAGVLVFPARGHAEKGEWVAAVRRAAWLRFALAAELEEWMRQQRAEPVFPHLPPVQDERWDLFRRPESGLEELTSFELRETLSSLTRPLRRGASGKEWLLYDPLCIPGDGRARAHHAAGERRLLIQLRRYLDWLDLDPDVKARERFEHRLLEYLRVRNAFHGLLIHDQGSEGLLRFSESLKRRGLGQRAPRRRGLRKRRFQRALLQMEEIRMEAALDAQLVEPFNREEPRSREKPLRRIEMRVSVPSGPLSLRLWRSWIDGIAAHLRAEKGQTGPRSQVGLVFHLHKGRSDERAEKDALEEALRLYHFLEGYPALRPLVVGFDVAGRERAAPPRTFLRAFLELQSRVNRHRPDSRHASMRLGYTFHVGEDCADLLTGLRHVDEVVSLLLPEEDGGRLGHALTLAESPRRFYDRRGLTEWKTGTHLLDLVWAWGRLLSSDWESGCQELQRKILRLMRNASMEAAIVRCWEAMRLDGGRPVKDEVTAEGDLLKVLGFQGEPEFIPVQADEAWIDLLTGLQALLRERIKQRRICIEANPTSNLIIGGYHDYGEIPCLALVEAGLPVSINTDDPGMFMTSLPGEASALYGALERKKWSHRDALVWLADRWFDAENSTFLGAPRRWTAADFRTMLRFERD
jgi:adenosine deaminase